MTKCRVHERLWVFPNSSKSQILEIQIRQVQTVWKQRHNESHSELLLSDAENRQIHYLINLIVTNMDKSKFKVYWARLGSTMWGNHLAAAHLTHPQCELLAIRTREAVSKGVGLLPPRHHRPIA